MVTIDEERDIGLVDCTDFAQAPNTLNVPGAETVHPVSLPAPPAPHGDAETTIAFNPQRQPDVRAPAGTDTPNATPPTNIPQGVSGVERLVTGLNLKTTLESMPDIIAAHFSGRAGTTSKPAKPAKPAVLATMARLYGWTGLTTPQRDGAIAFDEGLLKIEFLHRYNIFWARSRLFRHFHQPVNVDLVGDQVAGQIHKDLHEYCKSASDPRHLVPTAYLPTYLDIYQFGYLGR